VEWPARRGQGWEVKVREEGKGKRGRRPTSVVAVAGRVVLVIVGVVAHVVGYQGCAATEYLVRRGGYLLVLLCW
jgi:hypothetical protein